MRLLSARQLSVVTAESCTAGLVAAVLSTAEGASEFLHGGFVTYTKAQKTAALGIPANLLSSRGAVNEEVARRMALGALDRSAASIALSVTGVLGPEPDEDGNPVGLVFFACCMRGQDAKVMKRQFSSEDTDTLRRNVVMAVLDLVDEVASAS
jgi:nicotinamide-nucleotide amidase